MTQLIQIGQGCAKQDKIRQNKTCKDWRKNPKYWLRMDKTGQYWTRQGWIATYITIQSDVYSSRLGLIELSVIRFYDDAFLE